MAWRLGFPMLLLASALLAQEVPPSVAARESELEGIRGEIARLTARLERVKASAAGIEGELERLEVELELQGQRVMEAAAAKSIAEEKAAAAEQAIAELERRLAEERERLRTQLAGLYHMGRTSYLRMLLSLAPGEDLLPAVRALRYLARRDAAMVASIEDLRARLELEHRQLAEERQTAQAWYARESQRRDQLGELERRKSALLVGARREGERLASRALELGERARKLSAFLDALAGRSAAGLAGLPIQDFRGVLEWPLAAPVRYEFGPRTDPRYGTKVPHNGIDLSTPPGVPVRVVYPGKVLFAAPFEGFGPMVVVQHTGGALTLYAGLAELSVQRDDVLSLHALLGRSGTSLYFEIRVHNKPENPRSWLR